MMQNIKKICKCYEEQNKNSLIIKRMKYSKNIILYMKYISIYKGNMWENNQSINNVIINIFIE